MTEKENTIPNLNLDEQLKVAVQTKQIPLLINGNEINVEIQKLSTGVRNKIRSECTQTKILGGQPSVTVNDIDVQEKILSACIKTAPFDHTLQGIKNLPTEVSDYLFAEYSEFAEPTIKKKV